MSDLTSASTISQLRVAAQRRRELALQLAGASARVDQLVRTLRQGGYTWSQIAAAAGEDENTIRVRDKRRRRRLS